jgi:serine/threonine-protein kinase RsbW
VFPGSYAGSTARVDMTLGLSLPRDALSVPVVRRIATQSLRSVGFVNEDVDDIELALTEACSNVLKHSQVGEEYEVRTTLTDAVLVIEVLDIGGAGFEVHELGRENALDESETGRGIQLMRALVDDLRFTYLPGRGSLVSMTKTLRYDQGSPMAQLRLGR